LRGLTTRRIAQEFRHRLMAVEGHCEIAVHPNSGFAASRTCRSIPIVHPLHHPAAPHEWMQFIGCSAADRCGLGRF
jgi:hypothetical protein